MDVLPEVEWAHGGTKGPDAGRSSLEEADNKIAFLENIADKFEGENNELETIKALETSLCIRRAVVHSSFLAHKPASRAREEELQAKADALVVKCNLFGVSQFKRGDYDTGLQLLQKGMDLTSGNEDTNCFLDDPARLRLRAACLNNLGCLEKRRGEFNAALGYLQQAVDLETQLNGNSSPATSMNLCAVFNKLSRHDEALDEANTAITNLLAEKHHEGGSNAVTNHMLCVAYHNLALSQEFSLNPTLHRAAEDSYAQALQLARAELGPSHVTTLAIQSSIERFEKNMGRPIRQGFGGPPVGMGYRPQQPPPSYPAAEQGMLPRVFPAFSMPAADMRMAPEKLMLPAAIPMPPDLDPESGSVGRRLKRSSPKPPTPTKSGKAFKRASAPRQNRATSQAGKKQFPRPPSADRRVPIGQFSGRQAPGRAGDAAVAHLARVQARHTKKEIQKARDEERHVVTKVLYEKERKQKILARRKEEQQRKEEMAMAMYKKMLAGMRQEEVRKYRSSAKLIQKVWRGYCARKKVELWEYSAICIQAVVRSHLTRLWLNRKREFEEEQARLAIINKAATRVQVHAQHWLAVQWKRRREISRSLKWHHTSIRLQRAWRTHSSEKKRINEENARKFKMEEERQRMAFFNAAMAVQRIWRGHKARSDLQDQLNHLRLTALAAVKIQARIKGMVARHRYRAIKHRATISVNAQASALKIQKWWRGSTVRMDRKLIRELKRVAKKRARQMESASRIQRFWKCVQAKNELKTLKAEKVQQSAAALTIQLAWRSFQARKTRASLEETRKRDKAARVIQNFFRYVKKQRDVRDAQRYYDQVRAKEQAELRRTEAAIRIQAWIRGTLTRKKTAVLFAQRKEQHKAAIKIQKVWRGHHYGRKELRLMKKINEQLDRKERAIAMRQKAAHSIQACWRFWHAKRKAEQDRIWKAAAIEIQQIARGWLAGQVVQQRYDAKVHKLQTQAAIQIQRTFRAFKKRKDAAEMEEFYAKARRQKLLAELEEKAALKIQSWWKMMRCYRELQYYKRLRARAIARVWSWWRRRQLLNIVSQKVRQKKEWELLVVRSVVRIQSWYRGVLGRRYAEEQRELRIIRTEAAVVLQTAWRGWLARRERRERMRVKEQAHQKVLAHNRWVEGNVTLIQSHFRSVSSLRLVYNIRKFTEETKRLRLLKSNKERRIKAAIKIQAYYRGYHERFYCRLLKKERDEELAAKAKIQALQQESALSLQCWWRTMHAVGIVAALKTKKRKQQEELQILQEQAQDPADLIRGMFWTFEMTTDRNLHSEQNVLQSYRDNAAITIQKRARGMAARNRVDNMKKVRRARNAALLIERQWIACVHLLRKRAADKRAGAATAIQCCWRKMKARVEVKALRATSSRSKRTRLDVQVKNDKSAVAIQCAWRQFLALRKVRYLWILKQDHLEQRKRDRAARDIQRVWRSWRSRSN